MVIRKISPYGFVIESFQAFKAEDNQVYLDKAIAKANELNTKFLNEMNRREAISKTAENKRLEKIAYANRNQVKLMLEA